MLCGRAGTFQGLFGAKARHGAAAGALGADASARATNAMSATRHPMVRMMRTRVSVGTRNIQSGSAGPGTWGLGDQGAGDRSANLYRAAPTATTAFPAI